MVKRRKKRIGRRPASKKDEEISHLQAQNKYLEEQEAKGKRALDLAMINNFIFQVLGCPLSDRALVAGHELNQQDQVVNFLVPFRLLKQFCETVKRMEYGK